MSKRRRLRRFAQIRPQMGLVSPNEGTPSGKALIEELKGLGIQNPSQEEFRALRFNTSGITIYAEGKEITSSRAAFRFRGKSDLDEERE